MEMVKLFHPLTVGVNDDTGCRIWPEEYLRISKMNLFSFQGFFPTLEASKAALETVVFGLLGYGIVLRHPIKVCVCDGQCGYLDEDECIPSIYRDDLPEKTIIIYALDRPWTFEELIREMAYSVAQYMEARLSEVDPFFLFRWITEFNLAGGDAEEFALFFAGRFPADEEFMEWLSEEWRAARRKM